MKVGDWVSVRMRVRTINRLLPVYEVMLGSDDSLMLWVEESDLVPDDALRELAKERDALQSNLDRLYGTPFSARNYDALVCRAETAESDADALKAENERLTYALEAEQIENDGLRLELNAERQRSRLPPELVGRIKDGISWIEHDDVDDLLRDILAAVAPQESC